MTKEQALDKIQKLLNLADTSKNDSDGEAQAALLRAQELMVKYDVSVEEVGAEKREEYSEERCQHKWNMGFRVPLANALGKNFRCRNFLRGGQITFLGHPTDARICREAFEFAYNFIMKRGNQEYNRAYTLGKNTKGVFNSYATGFIIGLQKALDAQCTALAIVVPPDVNQKFEDMTANWKTYKGGQRNSRIDRDAYEAGERDGKEFMSQRKLEG